MSSPAAVIATLSRQASKGYVTELAPEIDEDIAATYVYDSTEQEQAVDVLPLLLVEQGQLAYGEAEKRQLRKFVKAAEQLQGSKDHKLHSAIASEHL